MEKIALNGSVKGPELNFNFQTIKRFITAKVIRQREIGQY
jgi:hypothetical protein